MKENKVAAITGASEGVGRAVAVHLASEGYSVAVCARRKPLIDEVADVIRENGGRGFAVKADVTVWGDVDNFIQSTIAEFGRIDVLINNAGSGIRYSDFEKLTVEEIEDGVAVNLTSVLYCCRAVLPIMKKQKSGYIINISSILGKRSRSGFAVYTAGKHGVEGFSRALFNEVKEYGIKVSILSPAMINTDWAKKAGLENLPGPAKVIEPEDIARVVTQMLVLPDHVSVWNVDLMALSQTLNPF
jgi:NADP-dependent 3-hydroxy acid dehydrogenase YdfG